ncbi:protein SSUH2 homolog, partial [Myripristis murdjan]|uniref:protein SSUH2 homolog n=1 Tax=Myripristis murdjan TaxID=586833 RepID=UPI0011763DFA
SPAWRPSIHTGAWKPSQRQDLPNGIKDHTTDCIRCDKGRLHCHHCASSGGKKCLNCGQVGALASYEGTYFCAKCHRVGSPICWKCSGLGWTKCDVCLGQGKVVVSISLTVQWTNNKEEHTIEQSRGLKRAKLDKVPWKVLFTESGNMVHPVTSFPDPTVVCTSERLVRKHQAKYAKMSRILQQRQTIELLPITKVTYTNGGESRVFFVYGRDFKVDAVDYPAACCSCCSVM